MAKEDKSMARGEPPARGRRIVRPLEEIERLMDEFWPRSLTRRPEPPLLREMGFESRLPRVDVLDRENEVLLRAELPGVDKKDLDVSVGEDSVTIKAETRREQEQEEGDYYRCEITQGSYVRSIQLPSMVDAEKVKANFKDGMLELTLPKAQQAKRRRIEIQ